MIQTYVLNLLALLYFVKGVLVDVGWAAPIDGLSPAASFYLLTGLGFLLLILAKPAK